MFWQGRRVFLTGHTGFKGSWLSLLLQQLGASVTGYSLAAPTEPSLFELADVAKEMNSLRGDILNLDGMTHDLRASASEIVIHMAAQSLVRESYRNPVDTYETNVLGTANFLEAVRACPSVRVAIVVTTDKCYQDEGWPWPYRENDRLGGFDPYSSSKACAELIVASYRNSFFPVSRYHEHGLAIATCRAGNVIGGGDWSADRLIPDVMRALLGGTGVTVRNPRAVRPWQYVLEPLRGYLQLAECLYRENTAFSGAWNFGPDTSDSRSVEWMVRHLAALWGPEVVVRTDQTVHPHESQLLSLDSSKARHELQWVPVISLDQATELTVDWYRGWHQGDSARDLTNAQIVRYVSLAGLSESIAAA